MKKNSTIVLVFNSKASRAQKHLGVIETFCKKNKIQVFHTSEYKNFEEAFVKALTNKAKRLIIAGGDGTIIGGIAEAKKQEHGGSYGIIPIGTANYLARNCGVSMDISEALTQSLSDDYFNAQLAKANDSLFALTATAGIGAEISKKTTRRLKKKYGQLSYLITTLKLLKTHKQVSLDITIDDNETINGKSHLVVVTNAQLSDTVPLAPDVALHKKHFKLLYYTSTSTVGLFGNVLLYVMSFGRIKRGYIERVCNKVELKTHKKTSIALDGDIRESTPATLELLDETIAIAH